MAQLEDGKEGLVDVDLADELSDGQGISIEPGGWYSSFFLHSDSGTSVTRGSWASSPLARVSMRMTGLTPRWCHASIMTSCISPALPMRYSVLSLAFSVADVASAQRPLGFACGRAPGCKARPVVDLLIDGLAHELVLRPVKRLVSLGAVPDALADGALLVCGRGAAGVSADRLTGVQSQILEDPTDAGRRVRQGALEGGGLGLDALLLLLVRWTWAASWATCGGGVQGGRRKFKLT